MEVKKPQEKKDLFKNFFDKRSTKYSLNTFLLIVLLLGILILVNFIAQKRITRIDLTKNKQYSLSDQSKKIIKDVDEDIELIGFYDTGSAGSQEFEDLAKEYQAQNAKVSYKVLDPKRKRTEAISYGVTAYPVIIIKKGDLNEEIDAATETEITSGLIRLIKGEKKKIYFISGHGEKEIEGSDPSTSYSVLKQALENQIYEIDTINLQTVQDIPEDADLVIMAGPKVALTDQEKEVLRKYIHQRQGKFFALLDPRLESGNDIGVTDLLGEVGINWNDGIVVDLKNSVAEDVATLPLDDLTTHQITEKTPGILVIGTSAASQAESVPEKWSVTEIIKTKDTAWLEKTITKEASQETIQFNEGEDIRGPVSVLVLAKEVDPTDTKGENSQSDQQDKARVAVLGDSDLVVDYLAMSGPGQYNKDLVLNTVNWLTAQEDLISISPKDKTNPEVTLTTSQSWLVLILTTALMPLLVVIIGIWVFLKRRKRKKT
ncbi:GldG family protein [Patescibacteria group bacterium]|nr:GldG family protein [Patescibacteria group bacterium]